MFDNRTDVVVRGALDGLSARHRAYANNVANAETPGFIPGEVPFEEQLRKIRDSLAGTAPDASAASPLTLEAVPNDQDAGRADGNGVQIDTQVMKIEENRLVYEALTQAARLRHEILHSAITETPR